MQHNTKGVSLIEVLVVVALIALLAAIGNYAIGTYHQARLIKFRSDFVSYLERARWLSLTSYPHGVRCDGASFSLVVAKDGRCSNDENVQCLKDEDCGTGNLCLPGDYIVKGGEMVVTLETRTIPKGFTLCCLSSCTSYTIWFDRKGIPRDGSWGLGMTTIEIKSVGSDSASVTISASGRIQYEH